MVDFTGLNLAIAAATAQATTTVGLEDSAEVIILAQGQATADAVRKALEEDNAADQTSIDAAVKAVNDVTQQFANSSGKLGAAIGAGVATPPVTAAAARKPLA